MLIARPSARPTPLERAIIALVRSKATGSAAQVEDITADDRIAKAIVAKADQTIGSTLVSGWASELTNDSAVGDFLGSLAPLSAAARLMAAGLNVTLPPGTSRFLLPARNGSPDPTTAWIGEGKPIKVRTFTFSDDCALEPKKFGVIVPFTRELVRRANGEAVIRAMLREEAAAQLDGAYFSNTAATADAHGGMLDGLSALAGYAGGDEEAMRQDLLALADVISPAGSGQMAFVVSPKRYARIQILMGAWRSLQGLTFLPSLAVADTTIIAVDPAEWVHGMPAEFDLEISSEAVVHMSDSPLEIVSGTGPTTADPVASFWQIGGITMRLIGETAFAPRRANAVAYLTGATW